VQAAGRARSFFILGLLVSLGVALFVAPFACSWPDGLEAVAGKLGFGARALAPSAAAPLQNYRIPGLASPGYATAAAGAIGTLVAFFLAVALSRLVVRENNSRKSSHI
jgi:hypothetical protein